MTPECEAIGPLLPEVLLDEAEPLVAARVRDHLSICPGCREESGRLSDLLRALRATGIPDPGAGYWESFLPCLRERIGAQRAAPGSASRLRAWGAAAAASILILAAAAALNLRPSAESSRRMALDYLAARADPETIRRTLDELLPGSDLSLPLGPASSLAVPRPAEMQRALDALLPGDDGDPYSAANGLTPEARQWLLKALMPDRV